MCARGGTGQLFIYFGAARFASLRNPHEHLLRSICVHARDDDQHLCLARERSHPRRSGVIHLALLVGVSSSIRPDLFSHHTYSYQHVRTTYFQRQFRNRQTARSVELQADEKQMNPCAAVGYLLGGHLAPGIIGSCLPDSTL